MVAKLLRSAKRSQWHVRNFNASFITYDVTISIWPRRLIETLGPTRNEGKIK